MLAKSIFAGVVLTLVLAMPAGSAEFWYGVDGQVPLKVDSFKVTIKFEDGIAYNEMLESIDRIIGVVDDEHVIDGFVACSLSTGIDYEAFLDSLETVSGVHLVEPYYLSENDYPLLVGKDFCVAFRENVTYQEIDSINQLYGVIIDRERIGRSKAFTLKNTDATGYRVVELANLYNNLPQVEYAHPDFSAAIEPNEYKLYDYYGQYQPHTKKVIGTFNSASVWDFAGLGMTLTVAVIDDGTAVHEDLPSQRLLPGYDFAHRDPNPTPGDSCAHGMATAGIVGASHTTDAGQGTNPSSGVISMNPNVNIMPIKIFNDNCSGAGVSVDQLVDAFDYAWTEGADILSNSWGFIDPDIADIPDLNQAIERATVFGRNGLGCPVFFSSGNTSYWFPDPSKVRYPARLPFCFAVGATQLDDYRWDYSCYGSELDMVAPSDDGYTVGVWGLDQMGNLGWNLTYMSDCPPSGNDVDYDCHFGGTSASCPLVAGTAALIMAKDSTFNFQGYYHILKWSAQMNLDWGPLPDTPHVQYGYGRVDAFRAMLAICRGDANNDGNVNIGDAVHINNYIFKGGPAPQPDVLTGDANCDGTVNTGDVYYIVNYIFHGGPAPQICFEY
jgi:subtilisin family serine protease